MSSGYYKGHELDHRPCQLSLTVLGTISRIVRADLDAKKRDLGLRHFGFRCRSWREFDEL